jgi:membrane-associated protease RseP (regulator of RpoE activity)
MVKSAPGFNPSGWDLVRAAWDLKARAAVAGVPIPETTKLVDHFAGLQQALALGDGRIIRVFATVNMGLAVLNLLPILPLDGGQIVWNCVIEWFDRGLVGKKRLANRRVWMRRFQTLALIGLAVIIIGQFIF